MVAVSPEIVFFDTKLIQERDYWTEKLSRELPPSSLRLDFERPTFNSGETETIDINLSSELCRKLAELTSNSSFLLYTTLMAGLKICLHKHNHSNTIVVGSPPLKELGRANALAIVDEIDPSLSFKEFLLQVRASLLDAYARQAYPFDYLVRDLDVNSLDKKCPLFDVALLLEDIHGPLLAVKHDLTYSFAKRANGLTGRVTFNHQIFTRETIERSVAHFLNVLDSALEDKTKRINDFTLLSPGERHTLLYDWNDTATPFPNLNLVQLFEAQAAASSHATAVVFEDQALSYAELNERANQLAHLLRARGVGPETIVGICLERSPEMIVALLATLKAGAAYLPLDINYPSQRLRYMIDDAGCRLVLTPEFLESQRDEIAAQSLENPMPAAGPDNIAYLIYTSGSTGKPKGVMVTHHGLANYLQWATERYAVSEGDGAPIHSPLSFDLTVTGLFTPLLAGRKVRLLKEDQGIDSLVESLRDEGGFSLVKLTPTHMEMLSQMLRPDEVAHAARALIIGGEALWGKHLDYWQTHAPHAKLINEYGPTETVVGCCVYEVAAGEKIKGAVPIGRAIANTQMYVLDAQLQPAAIGIAGELYIGGAGLARGYAGQPALTAERFIPNPFAQRRGERLYRTGDIGRWNRDGQIEYLGRRDTQVKVRGFRIELGEVEAALVMHPSVAECAVEVREGASGDQRLVCYLVVKDDLNVGELREHLLGLLPEYMVPSSFVELERMPVTANGKLDRSKLPQLETTHAATGATYVAPRTHVEEILAAIWIEILGLETVSVHDDFFELGGHSLIATQVMSRVREAFSIELPVRNLFETSTIAELAQSIEQELRGGQDVQASSIVRVARDEDLPLSFAQQRLWFLDQLESRTPAYNIPIVIRFNGNLNAGVLKRSLNGIVKRHEILRTNFRMLNGRPAQVIAPSRELEFTEIDLREWPQAERSAHANSLMTEEARKCFDLENGALLRATLLRLKTDEHVLLLTMHHIICDSWSMRIFLEEVAALYDAYSSEKPSPLGELPLQYADYAVWQREWLQGEVYEQQLDYWRKQLAGSPPVLELPVDRPRPALQTTNGSRQLIHLPAELTESLKRLSQKEGATLFMTLLAAFKVLLSRYTGQTDIVVGTPIAGRNRPEVEGLIGFFINTLVLRSDLSDDPSFRQLLKRVKETSLAAYSHQDLPFEKLVEELQPQRDLSHTPLFQVMLGLQNAPVGKMELPGLTLSRMDLNIGTAKFDLNLLLQEEESGLSGVFEYNTDLFEAETIAELATQLTTLLRAAVAEPDVEVSQLPLLTATERRRVLQQPNQTAQEYPSTLIHQLIEAQAGVNGSLPALQFEAETLSYAELNQRANQLAHYLRGRSVGPETVVGLCLERSLELVISILATLKAGGAYMPLDPGYPQERLRYMIANAGCQVVLTQALLDEEAAAIAGQSTENPISDLDESNSAYVIYTSGSTGQPKGVVNTHAGLRNRLQWMQQQYELSTADAVLQKTPFSFDVSVWEFLWPLMMGARLVVARPGGHQDSGYLVELIQKQAVTVMHFVPSMLRVFLQEELARTCESLRLVVCSGEALPAELVREFYGQFNSAQLENLYGPTEAAIDVSYWSCPRGEDLLSVPIGRPIANTELYVLDAQMEPVPVGVSGEIYIGGVNLARGYVSQPSLTAERFIPHPFTVAPGARLYRTGDVGRWNRRGELEYLGRADTQVKVRGFRIELGEIEAEVARLAEVAECVVEVRAARDGDQRLVCYVVLNEGAQLQVSRMREQLRERLPEYMVPGVFVELAELPLSAHGKLDRKRLPEPEGERPELELAYEEPRGELEREIASVWAEVLRVTRVGAYDNFFDLGGHSLLLVEAQRKLQERGLGAVSVVEMFQYPTVSTLARRIQSESGSAESVDRGQGRAEARRERMKRRRQTA